MEKIKRKITRRIAQGIGDRWTLEGKVAVITGAGTGFGEAIAHKFPKVGARIIVNGLPQDPVDDVVTATVYEGTVGDEVPRELREQPKGELNLTHSKDGLRGKAIHSNK